MNTQEAVNDIALGGHFIGEDVKVKFHYIRPENMENSDKNPYIITVCSVVNQSTKKVSYTFAFCNTEKDQFDKKVGRAITLGRFAKKHTEEVDFSGSSYNDFAGLWNDKLTHSDVVPRILRNCLIVN